MLQVHTEHIVLNAIGNMTAKTRYLILNIFDLLHDRHGCEGTACGLLTMLVAATLSKLSLSRLGSDNTHVTLDGNNVVVALTKTRRKRPNSGSSPSTALLLEWQTRRKSLRGQESGRKFASVTGRS